MSALEAVLRRRSQPKVTADGPTDDELLPLVKAAATVADHASLRPWRLIALRGEARERLGAAMVQASEVHGEDAERLAAKPLRAPLLIAVVGIHQPSFKVHEWEQEAATSGVAHVLSLLLDEAGWGVMWRSGNFTRSAPVHELHGLADNEQLFGWLYVGGRPEGARTESKVELDPRKFLSAL
jgi:nitroreductase